MSTRALVGVEAPQGLWSARSVHLDGYPMAMVPCLAAVVHTVYDGDQEAAVAAVTATHWSSLHEPEELAAPQAGLGRPSQHTAGPYGGRLNKPFGGDQEWAYLFFGDRLRVYLMVNQPRYRIAFVPFASWAVAALPDVPEPDLKRIQTRGQHARLAASWCPELHHIDSYRDETGRW